MEKNFYIDIIRLKIMFNLTKINLKNYKAKFMLKNSSILITGGTGSFGHSFVSYAQEIQS